MNAADIAFVQGFSAAIDLAERAGTAILAGQMRPLRRELAAGGLFAFVNEARKAIGNNVAASGAATQDAPLTNAAHVQHLPPVRNVSAIGHGFVISGARSVATPGSPPITPPPALRATAETFVTAAAPCR